MGYYITAGTVIDNLNQEEWERIIKSFKFIYGSLVLPGGKREMKYINKFIRDLPQKLENATYKQKQRVIGKVNIFQQSLDNPSQEVKREIKIASLMNEFMNG